MKYRYVAHITSTEGNRVVEKNNIRDLSKELGINQLSINLLINKKDCRAKKWVSIERFDRLKPTFKVKN